MTLKFTPPSGSGRYGVAYGQHFQVYNDLAYAKIAWHHRRRRMHDFIIVERVGDAWYELYRVRPSVQVATELPWYGDVYSIYGRSRRAAKPMTREEYAEWRVAVELERLAEAGRLVPERFKVGTTITNGGVPAGNLTTLQGRPLPGAGIEPDDDEDELEIVKGSSDGGSTWRST